MINVTEYLISVGLIVALLIGYGLYVEYKWWKGGR